MVNLYLCKRNCSDQMTERRIFTCQPDDDYLEFNIKTYPSHKGVTNELLQLKMNDELILHDIFGTITYKGKVFLLMGDDEIFYICGTPPMMDALEKYLSNLHVPIKPIVKEVF
jgi:hypothetical protein